MCETRTAKYYGKTFANFFRSELSDQFLNKATAHGATEVPNSVSETWKAIAKAYTVARAIRAGDGPIKAEDLTDDEAVYTIFWLVSDRPDMEFVEAYISCLDNKPVKYVLQMIDNALMFNSDVEAIGAMVSAEFRLILLNFVDAVLADTIVSMKKDIADIEEAADAYNALTGRMWESNLRYVDEDTVNQVCDRLMSTGWLIEDAKKLKESVSKLEKHRIRNLPDKKPDCSVFREYIDKYVSSLRRQRGE